MSESDHGLNPIPKTCMYLRKFIESHYRPYFEDMNEVGRGYGPYPHESEVIQHFRDVVHNLEESFKGVRIPEDFPSHVSLIRLINNFKTFLEKRRATLLVGLFEHFVKIKKDVPYPVLQADKITGEVIDALDYSLEISKKEIGSVGLAVSEIRYDTIVNALKRFDEFRSRLATSGRKRRRAMLGRAIRDEYDVQDLVESILLLLDDDIKAEEWTPGYLGKASRVDFLIPAYETVVECKMTRPTLDAKTLGDELLIDVGRYSRHKKCKTLIYFIYDPRKQIKKVTAFERDCVNAGSANTRVVPIIVR